MLPARQALGSRQPRQARINYLLSMSFPSNRAASIKSLGRRFGQEGIDDGPRVRLAVRGDGDFHAYEMTTKPAPKGRASLVRANHILLDICPEVFVVCGPVARIVASDTGVAATQEYP